MDARLQQRVDTQLQQLAAMLQAACAFEEGAPRDDVVGEMLVETLFICQCEPSALEQLLEILYRANAALGERRVYWVPLRNMIESQITFAKSLRRAKESVVAVRGAQ